MRAPEGLRERECAQTETGESLAANGPTRPFPPPSLPPPSPPRPRLLQAYTARSFFRALDSSEPTDESLIHSAARAPSSLLSFPLPVSS